MLIRSRSVDCGGSQFDAALHAVLNGVGAGRWYRDNTLKNIISLKLTGSEARNHEMTPGYSAK